MPHTASIAGPILDRYLGEALNSFCEHSRITPAATLSGDDLEFWRELDNRFTTDRDSLSETELYRYAANGEGHVFCALARLSGKHGAGLEVLADDAGASADADPEQILAECNIRPADYAEEMVSFIRESGLMPAFAEYLASSVLEVDRMLQMEDEGASPSI